MSDAFRTAATFLQNKIFNDINGSFTWGDNVRQAYIDQKDIPNQVSKSDLGFEENALAIDTLRQNRQTTLETSRLGALSAKDLAQYNWDNREGNKDLLDTTRELALATGRNGIYDANTSWADREAMTQLDRVKREEELLTSQNEIERLTTEREYATMLKEVGSIIGGDPAQVYKTDKVGYYTTAYKTASGYSPATKALLNQQFTTDLAPELEQIQKLVQAEKALQIAIESGETTDVIAGLTTKFGEVRLATQSNVNPEMLRIATANGLFSISTIPTEYSETISLLQEGLGLGVGSQAGSAKEVAPIGQPEITTPEQPTEAVVTDTNVESGSSASTVKEVDTKDLNPEDIRQAARNLRKLQVVEKFTDADRVKREAIERDGGFETELSMKLYNGNPINISEISQLLLADKASLTGLTSEDRKAVSEKIDTILDSDIVNEEEDKFFRDLQTTLTTLPVNDSEKYSGEVGLETLEIDPNTEILIKEYTDSPLIDMLKPGGVSVSNFKAFSLELSNLLQFLDENEGSMDPNHIRALDKFAMDLEDKQKKFIEVNKDFLEVEKLLQDLGI